MTTEIAIKRLRFLCDSVPALLSKILEEQFSAKEAPEKWSKKEILGHLIDSAANNHQRIVRGQFEENPEIFYDQDEWVKFNYYNKMDAGALISLWLSYNQHLALLFARIPKEKLLRTCKTKKGESLTLAFYISDYVSHAEHHLKQILGAAIAEDQ